MTWTREFKVGLFVFLSVSMLSLGLFYLAVGKGVFETMHTFTLSSKNGDGFTAGMPVVFSGFNIGTVDELELNDKGIVLIKVKIPDRHFRWIRADSSFILYRPLIGSARIVVNTANLQSPPLDPHNIPDVTTVNDINDTIARIEPVLKKVTDIADNVERLTRTLSDPKGNLNLTLRHAEHITSNLASKKSLAEMAVSDKESIHSLHDSLRKLKDITSNIDRILMKVDRLAEKADDQLYSPQGTLPQINSVLKDVVSKLHKIDKTIDNLNNISTEASSGMKDFRLLRSDIDDAVHAMDDVAKKLDALLGTKKKQEMTIP